MEEGSKKKADAMGDAYLGILVSLCLLRQTDRKTDASDGKLLLISDTCYCLLSTLVVNIPQDESEALHLE